MPPTHRAAPPRPRGPAAETDVADAHGAADDRVLGERYAAADNVLPEWSLSLRARLDPDEIRRARDLALGSRGIRLSRLRLPRSTSGETG